MKYSDTQITEYLESVSEAQVFGKSGRRLSLLEYLLRKELSGEGDTLKAYSIGVDVLNRKEDFDPAIDSSVRVEMGRLRTALVNFENSAADKPAICVEIPVGSYRPRITLRPNEATETDEIETGNVTEPVTLVRLIGAGFVIVCLIALAFYLRVDDAPPPPNGSAVRVSLVPFEGEGLAVGQVETALRQSLARNQSIAVSSQLLPVVGQVDFSLYGLVSSAGEERRVNVELLNVHTNRIVWTKSIVVATDDDLEGRVAADIGGELVLRLLGASKEFLEGRDPRELSDEQLFLMATWVPGPTASNSLAWEQQRLDLMHQVLERDPDLGTIHSVLADKLAQMANFYPSFDTDENHREIEEHITRATELAPLHPDVMFNIAQSHWHEGRMEKSHAAMRRVIDLDPGHDMARFLSAVMPYTCVAPPDQIVDLAVGFDQALAPDNPIRWLTLTWVAWLKLNQGDLEGALAAKEEASLIFETPYTFVGHAMLLNRLGRPDDAIAILKRQQLNWPGISTAHFANVTMPRLCMENEAPAGLLEAYEDLADDVFGKI